MYASGPAIAAMGIKEFLHGHTTRIGELAGFDLNRVTAEVVVQAAREDDRVSIEILQRAGVYLGIAVSNVLGVISPQRVIFGGGVAQAGELLLGTVRNTVLERNHVVPVEHIEFVQATLGDDAGLVGAALWAEHQIDGTEKNSLRSLE
jgi:glucokinase